MTEAEELDWWRDQAHRRMGECQQLTNELARLRETVAELESERDYWRELAEWAESDSFVTRPRPTRFQ